MILYPPHDHHVPSYFPCGQNLPSFPSCDHSCRQLALPLRARRHPSFLNDHDSQVCPVHADEALTPHSKTSVAEHK